MAEYLTVIGNANPIQSAATTGINRALPDSKTYDVGGYKFTGKAIKEMAAETGSTVMQGTTGGAVYETGLRTSLNVLAPGLGNILPVDKMSNVMEVAWGFDKNKPLNKYNLGDVGRIVGQALIGMWNPRTWAAGLNMIGIGPPTPMGKGTNHFTRHDNMPHFYAPTELNTTPIGSPDNYPHWYDGGWVIPKHSPFLAINELNASLSNDQYGWVIFNAPANNWPELIQRYNAGKLWAANGEIQYNTRKNGGETDPEPFFSKIWFEFVKLPKNDPNWNRYNNATNEWLKNLWQLNGQLNPVITPQAQWYTFAPNTDPGTFWLESVRQRNPAYFTTWATELAKKVGANIEAKMRELGIDPLTGAIMPGLPAPGSSSAATNNTAPPASNARTAAPAEASSGMALLGAAALAYFVFKK